MRKLDDLAVESAAIELLTLVSSEDTRDVRSLHARDLVLTGRIVDAEDQVMTALVKGDATVGEQRAAAALYFLATASRGRGRKGFARPKNWIRVGSEIERLVALGSTRDHARRLASKEFAMSDTSIREAEEFSRAVHAKIDQLLKDGWVPPVR